MSVSAKHKGWLFKPNEGMLAAVNIGAKGGASVLATNTALDGVLLGTPVTPALAVDSMVLSNLVASGDILIAANNGGNSQAWLWVDSSSGTLNLYGAGTQVVQMTSVSVVVYDDKLLSMGSDGDIVAIQRSASLDANTAVTNVLAGTPVSAATPANSMLVSNIRANGDIAWFTLLGGTNSTEVLRFDTSAGLIVFNEASADWDFRIESNGNSDMFVIDGALDAIGIGGAVVANQTLTVTNATLDPVAGRLIKLAGTMAAPNMADGYGMFEVDFTISGTMGATGFANAASAWVNIPTGTVGAGKRVCARNDGVYEASAATITNALIIFGARMHKLLDDTDALSFPFSLNTNNTAITALFDCQNRTDFGLVGAAGTAENQLLPILRDAAGNLRYVMLYTN